MYSEGHKFICSKFLSCVTLIKECCLNWLPFLLLGLSSLILCNFYIFQIHVLHPTYHLLVLCDRVLIRVTGRLVLKKNLFFCVGK